MNPKELSRLELERLNRGLIEQIADFIGPETDVPAPDVYTNARVTGPARGVHREPPPGTGERAPRGAMAEAGAISRAAGAGA